MVDAPVIVARDVSYHMRAYRSFEFVSFEVAAGELHAALSTEHAAARDMLLAVAGLVQPTAGSLTVGGVELAAPAHRGGAAGLRRLFGARERLPRGAVGLGVFEHVAPVAEQLTVEEAVSHEAGLRGQAASLRRVPDVLAYLASLGLATVSEQQILRLEPALRARLSIALACAGAPCAAVVDLTDPFVAGLSAPDAAALMADARAVAQELGTALLVATSEVACARATDAATALDIPAAEALAAAESADLPADAPTPARPAATLQEVTAR